MVRMLEAREAYEHLHVCGPRVLAGLRCWFACRKRERRTVCCLNPMDPSEFRTVTWNVYCALACTCVGSHV